MAHEINQLMYDGIFKSVSAQNTKLPAEAVRRITLGIIARKAKRQAERAARREEELKARQKRLWVWSSSQASTASGH